MTLTRLQAEQMLEAAKPLIQWIAENCNHDCTADVDNKSVVLREGFGSGYTDEFIPDHLK